MNLEAFIEENRRHARETLCISGGLPSRAPAASRATVFFREYVDETKLAEAFAALVPVDSTDWRTVLVCPSFYVTDSGCAVVRLQGDDTVEYGGVFVTSHSTAEVIAGRGAASEAAERALALEFGVLPITSVAHNAGYNWLAYYEPYSIQLSIKRYMPVAPDGALLPPDAIFDVARAINESARGVSLEPGEHVASVCDPVLEATARALARVNGAGAWKKCAVSGFHIGDMALFSIETASDGLLVCVSNRKPIAAARSTWFRREQPDARSNALRRKLLRGLHQKNTDAVRQAMLTSAFMDAEGRSKFAAW